MQRLTHNILIFALTLSTFAGSFARSARAQIEAQPTPMNRPEPAPAPQLTRAPTLVRFVPATYPKELADEGVGGDAVLVITIDKNGDVEQVTTKSAPRPELAAAAMVAATQLKFTPAEVNGSPQAIAIEYRYVFEPTVQAPEAIKEINFSGLVREAGTRKVVAGAVIAINGEALAETDTTGHFEIRGAPTGKLAVRIVSPAYEIYTTVQELAANEAVTTKYYLVPRSLNPFETVVRTRVEAQEVSKIQLQREELNKVPGTFGDPLKVLENLPGMARSGPLGGALIVLGTNPADTLVFMDGVEIPILYHFFGLTSVINPEFLERIDFYPGGFGARYGRATAGIVDITSRDLTCDKVHGSLKVDILDTAAYTCVPAGDWHIAAAGRRSYIDLLLPLVLNRISMSPGEGRLTVSPVFWDYQLKASRSFNNHHLELFAFGSNDGASVSRQGAAANVDFAFGLSEIFHRLEARDRWRLGEHSTLTSTLAPGWDHVGFGAQSSDLGLALGLGLNVWSVSWREDYTTQLVNGLTLNAGIDHSFGSANLDFSFPTISSQRLFPSPTAIPTIQARRDTIPGFTQGYYVELVAKPWQNFMLVPGLRVERYDFEQSHELTPLPRLTARWQVLDGTTLKAAYGIYNQLPQPQYMTAGIGNPALLPERAQHFVAGIEQNLTTLINLDVQGFYLKRDNLVSPSNNVVISNGRASPEIWSNEGSGRSYGLEILLRHLASPDSKFYGWIAYTLSRSLLRDHAPGSTYSTVDTDTGTQMIGSYENRATSEYLNRYDQMHILTVVGQWSLPWGLQAGVRFRLVSGNPVTPTNKAAIYYDSDAGTYLADPNSVQRFSARLPTFNQLDVRIDKTWTHDLWRMTLFLEVLNVYNATNPEVVQFDYRYQTKSYLSLMPLLPVLGIKGDF